MSETKENKNKSTKALFSIICLCIIALGLIVYFSTTASNKSVNEATTIKDTTKVQNVVTTTLLTTQQMQTTQSGATTTTTKETTTQAITMEQNDKNIPFKSYYKYPITDAVSKDYSEELTYDKTMADYRAHVGIDFKGTKDCEVVAINDGLVTDVYTDNMYGTVVVIDHGGKLVARYCGLNSVAVKKGSRVSIGNKIGTLGTIPCENAEGYHLHFETSVNKKPVNPLNVMSKIKQ